MSTVAIMDTGIVPHVDFGNRIRYFGDFCEGKTGLYDDNGHGTHVSGIVAGIVARHREKNTGCRFATALHRRRIS